MTNQTNAKEMLDGVDEEQLSLIISALEYTAKCFDGNGMNIVAQKMRLTADKVIEIKKARESVQVAQILGRMLNKEKTICS